jgi:hypothetical protein
MAERNWNTDGVLPASSDELDALLAKCSTPEQIRETCLRYAEQKGTIVRNPDGIHARATGVQDPDARTFSKIVTVNGRRMLLDGARSQAELDAAVAELEEYQR